MTSQSVPRTHIQQEQEVWVSNDNEKSSRQYTAFLSAFGIQHSHGRLYATRVYNKQHDVKSCTANHNAGFTFPFSTLL